MIEDYIRAETLEEALNLLEKNKGQALIIAGGTDLLLKHNRNVSSEIVLIDISAIPELVEISSTKESLMIGERINPTNRKVLTAQLEAGDTTMVRRDARRQVEAGAQVLDVNIGFAPAPLSWAFRAHVKCRRAKLSYVRVRARPPSGPLAVTPFPPLEGISP